MPVKEVATTQVVGAVTETECSDGEFRPQSVVLASQLETWRIRVIPQIMAWIERS